MPKIKKIKCQQYSLPKNPVRPARIILMRHAEKPKDKAIPTLSDKGYSRANALPPDFIASFGRPFIIYAASNSGKSVRPYETALPLALSLNMEVVTPYADKQYSQLINDIFSDPDFEGQTIVIFWHHGTLADMLKQLGGPVVKKWKKKVFDRMWILDYTADSIVYRDLPQRLLYGDSKS